MRSLLKNIVALGTCHWLAMSGTAVTTGSIVVFVSLALFRIDSPYFGLVLFLVLPAFFVLGLLLIPAGLYLKAKQTGGYRAALGPFAWGDNSVVRLLIVLAAATGVNVALLSTATSQGVEYMESAAFCTVCHGVMEPQYSAQQQSAHAEVACVRCHAPDTSSFVYHKMDGLRQLAAWVTDTYDRPIPSSGGRLHAASETCGACHRMGAWRNAPEQLHVFRRYADDEASTQRTTALLMYVGRIHDAHGAGRIQYLADDDTLQSIPWFSVEGVDYAASSRPDGEPRVMDCIDCHNRAGHDFGSAEEAADHAIREGEIDRAAPYARRDAVRYLTGDTDLQAAPEAVRRIRARSVFPAMRVSWDTYPSNMGHQQSPGCFRCHDGGHQNAAGEILGQDCLSCHSLLAVDDEDPEVLETLGIEE